ncbi:DMT family transporter [Hwanghaeella grinnelliae]|nr:DMT family transporter [Hwanghaeella grinnelliae]
MDRRSILIGAALFVLGAAVYTPVFASAKILDGQYSPIQILFVRYVSALVILGTLRAMNLSFTRHWRSPKPSSHLVRAAFGSSGGLLAIYAPALMPVAAATALSLTEIVFLMVLAAPLLGERVTRRGWTGAGICLTGALIIVLAPGDGTSDLSGLFAFSPWGMAAALGGAVLIAGEAVMIKRLSVREKAYGVLLYVSAFSGLIWMVPAVLLWEASPWSDLALMFALGPLAMTGQLCFILSYRLADAAFLAPFTYTWLIFASGLGFLAFGEVPSEQTIIGAVIIVGGGLVLLGRKAPA